MNKHEIANAAAYQYRAETKLAHVTTTVNSLWGRVSGGLRNGEERQAGYRAGFELRSKNDRAVVYLGCDGRVNGWFIVVDTMLGKHVSLLRCGHLWDVRAFLDNLHRQRFIVLNGTTYKTWF